MSKATTLGQLELHALKSANYTDKKVAQLGESVANVLEPMAETVDVTVLYAEQTLTDEQKAQARENIGIVGTGKDGYTPVKGVDYFDGEDGADGKDGEDYILTEADKAEIAEMVDGATVVQAPKYVNGVDEMTDTSRVYVMASTGRIWAYMDATITEEVTIRDNITSGYERGRLSSGGANSGDVQTHTLTPFIDLTKAEYQGKTIEIHLEGNRYISENSETYIMSALFDSAKNALLGRGYSMKASGGAFDAFDGENVTINGNTSAVLSIPVPLTHKGTGKTIAYMRFCGLGTVDGTVYITYKGMQTVTGGAWVDTGTSYSPSVSNEEMNVIAEQAASIVDASLLSVIGSGEVSV